MHHCCSVCMLFLLKCFLGGLNHLYIYFLKSNFLTITSKMRWITIITLHAQYADWIFSKLNWWDEILIFTTTLQIYEVLICLVLHHPLHCLHHFDFTCLNFWFNNIKRISLQIRLSFFVNAWSELPQIFLRTLIWTCRH